ncbi:MAG TPA: glycosyltransferase family 2 protein [Elusimicrobiota bacterium]|nr:glycosyltransferase family 2 protein [Elusimicrobiota bacterium]
MTRRDFLIVIPAHNEEKTIERVAVRSRAHADVCVVDDGSTDSTPLVLSRIGAIHVITHRQNTNIPGAILSGMRYAKEKGYGYVITLDAGMSHDPDEIPLFMNHPEADLLIGCRVKREGVPVWRRMLSFCANLAYNIGLDRSAGVFKRRYFKDLPSGFRRYSNKAVDVLLSSELKSRSFDFLFESAKLVYGKGLTISEVPITYRFTNSSLGLKTIGHCLAACLRGMGK